MGLLLCSKCKLTKEDTDFHKAKTTRGHVAYCKACSKVYLKAWTKVHKRSRKNRKLFLQTFLSQFKTDNKCSVCQESEPICLDFHHVDSSTKTDSVSKIIKGKISHSIVADEVSKCIILCSNCHRKHHIGKIDTKNIPLCSLSKETIDKAKEKWNPSALQT